MKRWAENCRGEIYSQISDTDLLNNLSSYEVQKINMEIRKFFSLKIPL